MGVDGKSSLGTKGIRVEGGDLGWGVGGQRQQVVSASDRLGGDPGQWDAERIRGRLRAAEVHGEPEVVVLVGTLLLDPVRRGDVVRHPLALPLGVLRGHRGYLTGSGEVRSRRGVSARVYLRPTRDA